MSPLVAGLLGALLLLVGGITGFAIGNAGDGHGRHSHERGHDARGPGGPDRPGRDGRDGRPGDRGDRGDRPGPDRPSRQGIPTNPPTTAPATTTG